MHPLRLVVEAGDVDGTIALLAEDVVFRSPVIFAPFHGRETVGPIVSKVIQVFEDFRFRREIGAPGAADHSLEFTARVGDRDAEGCVLVHTDENGLFDDLRVMIRPMSAVLALREAMRLELAAPAADRFM